MLLSFHSWFKLRSSQFGFPIKLDFYDFLMKMITDSRADISEPRVHTVWQEFQLLKSREGTDIYTPSVRSPSNPKQPKVPRVEPSPKKTPALKCKGDVCWNFNKVKGCTKADCAHPHVCSKCGGKHPAMECTAK